MAKPSAPVGPGIAFFLIVFLVLLVLKLVGVAPFAAWSWWRVTSPLWGPWAFVLAMLVVGLLWEGLKKLLARFR